MNSARRIVLIYSTNILLWLFILTIGSIIVSSKERGRENILYLLIRLIVSKSDNIRVRILVL
jgi:hypothetical protein